MKKTVRDLQKNLEWFEDLRDINTYMRNDEANLYLKLDSLAHMDVVDGDIEAYLSKGLHALENLLPEISNSSTDFREKYLLSSPFLQNIVKILGENIANLQSKTRVQAFNTLYALKSEKTSHFLNLLYRSIHTDENVNLGDKLSILSRLVRIYSVKELVPMVRELIVESICEPKFTFTTPILSLLTTLNGANVACTNELIYEVMKVIEDHVYQMDPPTLLALLQSIYTLKYVDDGLVCLALESLLFKYNYMNNEEKMTLLLQIPLLKQLWLGHRSDISTSIYSEPVCMLNCMLRKHTEYLIEHMSLRDALSPSIAIANLFRQCKVVRKVLIKKLSGEVIQELAAKEYCTLLTCMSRLYISSAYNEARLVSKHINKLLEVDVPSRLLALQCLKTILVRKDRKLLLPVVDSVINEGLLEHIVPLLSISCRLKLYRIDETLITRAFSKVYLLAASESRIHGEISIAGTNKEIAYDVEMLTGDTSTNLPMLVSPESLSEITNSTNTPSLVYTDKISTQAMRIKMKLGDLIILLESSVHGPLAIPIIHSLYASIFPYIENTRVGMDQVSRILHCMTESRVVNKKLYDSLMETIYNDPSMINDLESAAKILRSVEFINDEEWVEKLSFPLFQYVGQALDSGHGYAVGPESLDGGMGTNTQMGYIMDANLQEVLLLQKYKRPEFYREYTKHIELPIPISIRPTTGNLHNAVRKCLGGEFNAFHELDGIIVDFYSPVLNIAVQIVKRGDYGGKHLC
ncbi:hypothetical protein BEWA_054050 [Theileria equi strain WA]|uniref:Uncharacterized protein n=1 Tax=Theileria equi strain WA TaxID=1537102 RepID=L1LDK4_THEEQ|nr:hypothetical protein BEWA_054050 [Theileria equi strain WA]EKX73349.1 hypothetical protein BEWA_054050 [Theileria equi strain WA]|eukprot:XP_004832801.1 hypothetical protein BEWA_054050 [Theileria equi strain WA]